MIPNPRLRIDITDRGRAWSGKVLITLGALGLSATVWAGSDHPELVGSTGMTHGFKAGEQGVVRNVHRDLAMLDAEAAYSTPRAERMLDQELARTQAATDERVSKLTKASEPDQVPRVASTASRSVGLGVTGNPLGSTSPTELSEEPILRAKQMIAACQERYRKVQDYTCTFHKRERIDGKLLQPHIMTMKARTQPHSLYFKFQQPKKGREAIYVAGRHGGKIVAHDVGLGKFLAGTMNLDPKGSMAMEENRHPVTEAGLGSLIETVAHRWAIELTPGETRVTFHENMLVGKRPVMMVETVHPHKRPLFLFHMVRLYIDAEHGLPIRIESYDWPKHVGAAPELVEEYSYLNLRTNVGLSDQDFEASNPQYSYGRF